VSGRTTLEMAIAEGLGPDVRPLAARILRAAHDVEDAWRERLEISDRRARFLAGRVEELSCILTRLSHLGIPIRLQKERPHPEG
jgi:hypothetical protein